MFKKIISIITIENSKELKLVSYSIDFEKALIETLKTILPKIRTVGCFYHYCKNIYSYGKKLGLLKENLKDNSEELFSKLYEIPYKYNFMKPKEIENIFSLYIKIDDLYKEYLDYFKKTWEPFFENGMLNYVYISKEQRSNSYIENYNRIVKEKLSNFLYGKNKCRISWPLMLYFIINEENEYKNNIIRKEISPEVKSEYPKKFIPTFEIKAERETNDNDQYFLMWNANSCRYDAFFYIYTFAIGPYIQKYKFHSENIIFKQMEKIRNMLLKGNNILFKNGIWKILSDNKIPEMDLTSDLKYFKRFNSALQPINLLKDIDLFCFKYKVYEGCSLCKIPVESYQYLLPSIEINKEQLLNNISVESIIKSRLSNHQNACLNCGYDKDGKIIDNNNSYFKIYSDITPPQFYFINIEFLDENEINLDDSLEEQKKNFELRIPFNKEIYEYMSKNQKLFGFEFKLIGIICTPQYDHYNGIILGILNNIKKLVSGSNYFNDGRIQNSKIILIENLSQCILDNNPYIGVYSRLNK